MLGLFANLEQTPLWREFQAWHEWRLASTRVNRVCVRKIKHTQPPPRPGPRTKRSLVNKGNVCFLSLVFFPTLSPSSPCVPLKSSRARGGESCFRSPSPAINSSGNCRRRREGGERDLDQFCNWKTGRNFDERCPLAGNIHDDIV